MKFFAMCVTLMLITQTASAANEKYYQTKYCTGKTEVVLSDKTRIDCETGQYAIEFDFAKKWNEGISQSLHYAMMTGKLAGLVLIVESAKDCKYVKRAEHQIEYYWLPIRLQTVGRFDCK